jgi:UDP-glucose 4-epimerase
MKRVLITGISSYWGGRLAQALERDPEIETVIGVSSEDPTCELERAEYVRVGAQHGLLRRIVQAAEIDTVVDTRMIVDSATTSPKSAHENNVIGTMNILTACSGPATPVKKLVFKSSAHYYGSSQDDPGFFTEDTRRPHPPATLIEKDIVDAERAVASFAQRNRDIDVTVLRFCNALPGLETSFTRLLGLPGVPGILGFDPRLQFIHEDDIVSVLMHAVYQDLPGVFNASPDGVLVLSEVAGLLGKPLLPLIPPYGTGAAVAALKRLGLRIPEEMINQLRYGRGLDNRKLKATGYRFHFTTRETVQKLGEHLRVGHLRDGTGTRYVYEREVEEFLRRSPSVKSKPEAGPQNRPPQGQRTRARSAG